MSHPSRVLRLLLPLALALCARAASAYVPTEIPIQGLLTQKEGPRLDGPVPMQFALYTSEDATTAIWTESQTLTLTQGYFAGYLGAVTAIDPSDLADVEALWVGVSVDGGAEIGRLRLASTAFAFRADSAGDAETLGGQGPDAFARADAVCPTGTVMNGVTATGAPSCVADRDTLYDGSDFVLVSQQCPTGRAVLGVDAAGALVCGAYIGLTCPAGDILGWDASGPVCSEPFGVGDEADPVFGASAAKAITSALVANWSAAYGWGDHAAAGYVEAEADPVFGASAAKNVTAALIANWSAAYGWGDHAAAGYVEAEADPVFGASAAKNITAALIANWSAAYGWGDHAAAGYVEDEEDPVFEASAAKDVSAAAIAGWDEAYGWGDHASAGYLQIAADDINPTAGGSLTQTQLMRVKGGIGWQIVLDRLPYSHVATVCSNASPGSLPLAVPIRYADTVKRTGDQLCALNPRPQKTCKAIVSVARTLTDQYVTGEATMPNGCADDRLSTPWPIGSTANAPDTATNNAWPFSWLVCCGQ